MNQNLTEVIEVRIPTYKRPDLLQRALKSLVRQSYPHWKGIVIDDSPDGEGEDIVGKLADSRFSYRKNVKNLGLVKNLSLCFSSKSFFPDSSFACVLEDDNYYRDTFLKNAVFHLSNPKSSKDYQVFLGNAQVAQYYQNGREILQDRFTLSPIYGEKIREISYIERLQNTPYNTVIGNLCLVWRLNQGINFEIEGEEHNAIVQEKMRGLAYKNNFIYDSTPNAVFTNFPERVLINKKPLLNKRWKRSQLSLMRFWYKEMIKMGLDYRTLPDQNKIREFLLEALIINNELFPVNLKEIERVIRSILIYGMFPSQSKFESKG